jgi:hypothetical protein
MSRSTLIGVDPPGHEFACEDDCLRFLRRPGTKSKRFQGYMSYAIGSRRTVSHPSQSLAQAPAQKSLPSSLVTIGNAYLFLVPSFFDF